MWGKVGPRPAIVQLDETTLSAAGSVLTAMGLVVFEIARLCVNGIILCAGDHPTLLLRCQFTRALVVLRHTFAANRGGCV